MTDTLVKDKISKQKNELKKVKKASRIITNHSSSSEDENIIKVPVKKAVIIQKDTKSALAKKSQKKTQKLKFPEDSSSQSESEGDEVR
jgi:hypothetical protein